MFRLFINQDERKIVVISGITLVVLVLLSGFIVYKILQSQTTAILNSSLETTLESTTKLIETQISHSIENTKALTSRIFLLQSLEKANSDALKDEGQLGLIQSAEKILDTHFSNISIFNPSGDLILRSGPQSDHSKLMVQLDTGPEIDTFLMWDEQFIVRNSIRMVNEQGQFIGRIVTEEYVTDLTRIFTESTLISKTSDFLLCIPAETGHHTMDCFIRGVNGNQFNQQMQRIINNKPLPIHYALAGQKGIKHIKDYRQIEVVAAHRPVAFGLGAVMKVDESDLHEPFANQIQLIVFSVILMVLSGMAILYWLTAPLIRKSISTKQVSLKIQRDLMQAKTEAEKISAELTAYMDAIGKLALISIADRKGKIIQANEKFCEISGYTEEELIGKDHRILNSREHPQSFWVNMWATISKGQTWHREVCNRNKSGNKYWVDSTIVPLLRADGKIDRYLSVRVDITDRKLRDIDLSERLKESNCLHIIRNHMERDGSTEKVYQNILKSLVMALQFPERAVAMIEFQNKKVATSDYCENLPIQLNTSILANGEHCGYLQVAYTENLPFLLPYEQHLIDTIAHDLGRWHERKEAEQRIIQMATHDALTGLPNRHLLQDRVEQALAHESRNNRKMAVLFIDLDHFKTINDSLGHDIGDLLLKTVAKRLLSCVRNEDTVARQGGDEFIVVLNTITESLDAAIVAEKILSVLMQPYQIQQHELHIGGSIGIAVYPDDGITSEILLKNSDVAMYHAKENGRNNYQFFTEELNQSAYERHMLGLDLRHALERDEFVLFYQPVINMPDKQLYSMEALIRWQHPKHQLVSPDKFISLAEETGLIIPIGEWVLRTVCKQIKLWQQQGYITPRVAINLSARQFRDKALVTSIANILQETGVTADQITLEITESMLIHNIEKAIETLICLHQMGIQISIDDFGTGYSSLSYLKRFPIQTLKIDRSFVRDITIDKNDHTIVSAIIAMAHSLEIDVIAEGIETQEQLDSLMVLRCKHYQGYYFSKPVPEAEMNKFLAIQSAPVKKLRSVGASK